VAAYILKERGYEVVGAMMKLFDGESSCCSAEDAEDARAVANALGIPFHVFNFTDTFERDVIARFVSEYENGRTPNPCIDCNRYLKFTRFLHRATELECDYIATGHYARVSHENGRFVLKTGLDALKDQSYALYAMTQEHLARTLLPLGELTKAEVREIAEKQGFINAKKRDSQDICFAPDGDYAGFISRHTGATAPKGNFISTNGDVLGTHNGLTHYTIGQRKGLGISAPHPLYVQRLNPQDNTITLGTDAELFTNALTAHDVNFISMPHITGEIKCTAKVRYAHAPVAANLLQIATDRVSISFDGPVRAITPGQAVVCYDSDTVICGGTICY
jgi:tRNA-specific 2-thiouridylase